MPSQAYITFDRFCDKEVDLLIRIFEDRNKGKGKNTDYTLLHSALVLLVSGWETYCEGVSSEAVSHISSQKKAKQGISFSQLPDNVRRDLIEFASANSQKEKDSLKSCLAKLPDDGWRELLKERVQNYLTDFNTPRFHRLQGKSLKELFALFLSTTGSTGRTDIMQKIAERSSAQTQSLCGKVDGIITIRGHIAHTGAPKPEDRLDAIKLRSYVRTFLETASLIEQIIYDEYRERYNLTPWNMTERVLQYPHGGPASSSTGRPSRPTPSGIKRQSS